MQNKSSGALRVMFVGWGAIGSRVGDLLARRSSNVDIAGVATIDTPAARALIPSGIPFVKEPAELARSPRLTQPSARMRERSEVSFSCGENGLRARRFPIKTPHLFTSPRMRGERSDCEAIRVRGD